MFLVKITNIFCIALFITQCKSDCVSSVDSFKNILVLDSNNNIEYPNDGQGSIVKKEGEYITLACPRSFLNTRSNLDRAKMTMTCNNNYYIHNVKDVTCVRTLISRERRLESCNGKFFHLQIGYQFIGFRGDFIPHIDLCWDNIKKRALWTYAKLKKNLGECQESIYPGYQSGVFLSTALSKYYTRTKQLRTLTRLFRRIPTQINTNNLLEVGQLTSKCDFVYDAQQRLSFHYTNAAPRWKSLDGAGNWKTLGANIRELTRTENTDLDVYTGTFGVLKIEGKDYYLSSHNSKMPVPRYFWKVVIKKEYFKTLGVAIVVSNDILNTSPDPCTDIMGSINWLNIPEAKSRLSGYMIACKVSDFVNIPGLNYELPTFPALDDILFGNSETPIGD